MKIHRFIGDYDLSKNTVEIVNPENIKQIKDVLRLKVGEKIILSDGKGAEAQVTLKEIFKNKMICTLARTVLASKPFFAKTSKDEDRKVSLYLSILKKENFELAVQKAVECGVAKIIPIITERTIKTGLNFERLQKIIREASEQSGRNIVPTLSTITNFEDAITEGEKSEEKIIFHASGEDYHPNQSAKEVSIFIGPEGGFTEKEVILAKESGYKVASLGPLTLRGETAAIVATYRMVQGI